jgi:hypothetical protein
VLSVLLSAIVLAVPLGRLNLSDLAIPPCRSFGAHVLIDDNPRYALECAEARQGLKYWLNLSKFTRYGGTVHIKIRQNSVLFI